MSTEQPGRDAPGRTYVNDSATLTHESIMEAIRMPVGRIRSDILRRHAEECSRVGAESLVRAINAAD